MADYQELATILLASADFAQRVKLAAESKAKSIALETADGLEVSARKRYARTFIRKPDEAVSTLVFFVALDPTVKAKTITVQTDITDAEIDGALSDAVWNKLAEALA